MKFSFILSVALCVTLLYVSVDAKKKYHNECVVRFDVTTEKQAQDLENFVEKHNLDMWTHRRFGPVDVRVSKTYLQLMKSLDIPFEYYIEDLQAMIDEEERAHAAIKATKKLAAPQYDFTSYQTYEELKEFYHYLASNYSSIVKFIKVGTSLEGEDIFGIVITSNVKSNKPGIFYNALIHAREWITGATLTYVANQLITQYGHDDEITKLVDSIEWTIVPVLNVDGYRYTYAPRGERLWRKNRREITSRCTGIDLNRNWATGYRADSVASACSETYSGQTPFSEPEHTSVAEYIKEHTNIVSYIDFHSYSQLFMWPWGYTAALPKDQKQMKDLGIKTVQAIESVHKTPFEYGNIYTAIYPTYGGSVDYTYGALNVTYSYAVELRDTGRYGFLLPPTQIIPSGEEIFNGVKLMANYILDEQK